MGTLHPAENVLFACAVAQAEPALRDGVDRALSRPDIDWPQAVQLSLQHGVAPIVARQLERFAGDPRVPAEVTACFARIYRSNGLRNRVLFRETARLTRALEAAKIPCMVLKGVGLALTVYTDPALRNFADIDILVDPRCLDAAGSVAESCGFTAEHRETSPVFRHSDYATYCPEDILSGTLAPEFDSTLSPETITRLGHRVALEIHRGLFCLPSGALRDVDMTPFWESPQTVALPGGTAMCVPAPEAMLVHLAAHAAGDIFRRLLFPTDIALLLHCYGDRLNWEQVAALADRYAVQADLYRLLEFVAGHFGGDIPPEAWQRLQPNGGAEPPLLPADIFNAMASGAEALTWQRWTQARGLRELLISAGQILFPAPSTMRRFYGVRSPALLAPLYLLRPLALAWRLPRVALRIARTRRADKRGQGRSACPL